LNRQPVAKISVGAGGSVGLTLAAPGEQYRERNGDQPPAGRVNAAEDASRAKEWRRAAALWDELRLEAPIDARHWAKAAEAYCEAGLLDSADELLAKALGLFPGDAWLAYFYSRVARRRQDWPEFLGRAEKLWTDFPDFWRGWIEFADALSVAGRKADAEARRREARQRFPTEFWPNFWVAWQEARNRDAAGAVEIWSELVHRFPGQPAAVTALDAAREACGEPAPISNHNSIARDVVPVSDDEYRCPTDLAIVATPLKRVMVIGSCLSASWPAVLEGRHDGCTAEHFLINHRATLPADMPGAAAEYDFHLIQLPLRQLLNEHTYFGLPFSDAAAFERLFDAVCGRLTDMLHDLMRWNRAHGVLTFVCNFLVPQQNPIGRLLPRYDLRNFVYLIEKLNEALGRELQQYENAYLFDFDQIVGTYGRRYVQDDAVWTLSHGSGLTDTGFEQDTSRLEPLERISRYYPLSTHKIVQHACAELVAMYRTIRQDDMVKLVLVDLDDTLWRGVAAEEAEASSLWREGWPVGFVEALMFLKQRGVLLGIVSKNDEDRVRAMWQRIYGDLIQLEEFAVRKINWRPKADNIEAILRDVNLLPKSVVFIDDNPVERAAVKAAFPDIRVLGPNPYLWRRILLWAPETQVAAITAESAARTEMVQKQVERETQRKKLGREDFLASLEVRASLGEIASTNDARFARALELINKTNQFNTTGKRWTQQELAALFRDGGRCFVLDVTDRFTRYGIVGVLLVEGNEIAQFVMSCRVVGMDVEIAAVAGVLQAMAERGMRDIRASLVHTSANLLCRDLWERCGFLAAGAEQYQRSADPPLAPPAHIAFRLDPTPQPALSAAE
jgi:FkbH-like protein